MIKHYAVLWCVYFKLGCSQGRAILRLLRFRDFLKIYSIYFIIDKLVLNLDTIGIYRCRQAQPEARAELNLAVWPRSALQSAPYTALSAGTLQILFMYVYIKHAWTIFVIHRNSTGVRVLYTVCIDYGRFRYIPKVPAGPFLKNEDLF